MLAIDRKRNGFDLFFKLCSKTEDLKEILMFFFMDKIEKQC